MMCDNESRICDLMIMLMVVHFQRKRGFLNQVRLLQVMMCLII